MLIVDHNCEFATNLLIARIYKHEAAQHSTFHLLGMGSCMAVKDALAQGFVVCLLRMLVMLLGLAVSGLIKNEKASRNIGSR